MDDAPREPLSPAEHDPQTALHRCLSLRAAGDLHGARAAALDACAAAPNAPAPHYALGEICSELGSK
jgi:hypothetical protein